MATTSSLYAQPKQTTGRGNKRTMLLRVGMMGFENTNIHPTRFAITIPTSTMPSIERVEVYQTNNPEFYADPNPRLMASVETPNQNSVDIDLADYQLTQHGLNIIKAADGTCKKVVMK